MRESTGEWESVKGGERGRKGKEEEIGSERERGRERGYKALEFVKRAYLQLWSAPCSRFIFAPHETHCGTRACVRHTRKEFVKRA
eukprot:3206495-Pleurochrysis_carterae.AAC.1